MKKSELVALVKSEKIFEKMPEKEIQRIVNFIFGVVTKGIDEAESGKPIKIQGLGVFRKREMEKDGKTINVVFFKRAQGKPSKEI